MKKIIKLKPHRVRNTILVELAIIFVLVTFLCSCVSKLYSNGEESSSPTAEETCVDEIIFATTTPSDTPPRYGFTEDDIVLLAQLLCGDKSIDGDGEYDIDFKDPNNLNYNEISKVFCVVMNRVRSDLFPNTVSEVIFEDGQFSVMPENSTAVPSDIAIDVTTDWCTSYDNYDPGVQSIPETDLYFSGDGITNLTWK